MRHHLRRWGVVYFLSVLALVLNAVHMRMEYVASTYSSHEVPWNVEWLRSTMENLQSEVWQIWLACLAVDAMRRTKFWFRAKEEE